MNSRITSYNVCYTKLLRSRGRARRGRRAGRRAGRAHRHDEGVGGPCVVVVTDVEGHRVDARGGVASKRDRGRAPEATIAEVPVVLHDRAVRVVRPSAVEYEDVSRRGGLVDAGVCDGGLILPDYRRSGASYNFV